MHTLEYPESKLIIDAAFMEAAGKEPSLDRVVQMLPGDAAMAVYTSGSTGEPKGIVHEQRSITAFMERTEKCFEIYEGENFLSLSPYNFIAILGDIMFSLWAGLTIHIMPEGQGRDIKAIQDYIADHDIAMSFMSAQLLKYYQNKGKSFRYAFVGSERVSQTMGRGFQAFNIYGSSETAAANVVFRIDELYDNTPIGKPMDGIKIYLLDENGNLAAKGEEGEICVSGAVARGYLNRPEETKKAFVKNPFSEEEEYQVLYHTGDIGRQLPDGNYVYVNRKDWMVKINGQRVETGEIETILATIPAIDTAVVKGFENVQGQTYLCAYYTIFGNFLVNSCGP